MKDSLKLFNYGEHNSHNRTIKFISVAQINDQAIIDYIKESVELNKKVKPKEVKTLELPVEFKNILQKNKLLKQFEKQNYTSRKEIIIGITSAKKESTKYSRIEKV